MRRIASVVFALCMMFFSFSSAASAAENRLVAQNLSAKEGRLVDVPIIAESAKTLTASTFTLSYDTSALEVRSVQTDLSGCEVESADSNGKTVVIFLCAKGVKPEKSTELFTVTYKKLTEADTELRIKSSDCVGENAKNIPAFDSCVCKVSGEKDSLSSDKNSGSKSNSKTKSESSNLKRVSGGYSKTASDVHYASSGGSASNKWMDFVPLAAMAVLILVAAVIVIQHAANSKRSAQKDKQKTEEPEKQPDNKD